MMIALVILSLVGALTAVHIKKLIDGHRFEREVSNLFIELQEAQVLSSAYKTDITLDIYREEGELHYQFQTAEPFKASKFNQKAITLKHAGAVRFKDKKITALHLDIYSGRIEPRGILTFLQTQEDDSKSLWFDLQYGQLLKFSYRKPLFCKQQVPEQPK
jgi:hypothetical protein